MFYTQHRRIITSVQSFHTDILVTCTFVTVTGRNAIPYVTRISFNCMFIYSRKTYNNKKRNTIYFQLSNIIFRPILIFSRLLLLFGYQGYFNGETHFDPDESPLIEAQGLRKLLQMQNPTTLLANKSYLQRNIYFDKKKSNHVQKSICNF